MSDHDPINELTDVVDLFGAGAGRAESSPVADDGLPKPAISTGNCFPNFADGADQPYYTADQVRQAMREAYEAGRAAGVPDGWKLVPVEPTEAMVHAGQDVESPRMFGAVYRAMLAAAPQPPKDAP